jgi:lipopolysaccharide transport system permease protein
MVEKKLQWEWEIRNQTSWLGASFKELYSYKDLLFRLVRKDFLSSYQQTLLGPFWAVMQPIMTVFIYVLVFYKVMGASTQGIPPILYYLAGVTLWNLFSDIFQYTSVTFSANEYIFSKVYFPRIITPLSVMALHSIRFFIQLLMLFVFLFYYFFTGKVDLHPLNFFLAIPVIIITAGIGLGTGLVFSILTAKYRDLQNMIQLMLRLLMFVCPIFYSLSIVSPKIKWLVLLNPLTSLFETFRFAFLGKGEVSAMQLLYSTVMMVIFVIAGMLVFNKMGDKLIDVI